MMRSEGEFDLDVYDGYLILLSDFIESILRRSTVADGGFLAPLQNKLGNTYFIIEECKIIIIIIAKNFKN